MPPVPIITPTLLAAIRAHPFLPRNSWHFVSAAALNALNRPDEMANVFKYAIGRGTGDRSEHELDTPEQLVIIRQMREALVKSAAICGLPRSINSLLELRKVTPPELLDEPLGYSPTGRSNELYDLSSSPVLARGKRFFDLLYGKISARVMGQMDSSGTEDLGLTARLMYSFLLSNEKILDASQTSYVLLAGLIPQDVNAQLKGHLVGATHHEGVSVQEVKAVREVVIKICEASGMTKLDDAMPGGWGWRQPISDL